MHFTNLPPTLTLVNLLFYCHFLTEACGEHLPWRKNQHIEVLRLEYREYIEYKDSVYVCLKYDVNCHFVIAWIIDTVCCGISSMNCHICVCVINGYLKMYILLTSNSIHINLTVTYVPCIFDQTVLVYSAQKQCNTKVIKYKFLT